MTREYLRRDQIGASVISVYQTKKDPISVPFMKGILRFLNCSEER